MSAPSPLPSSRDNRKTINITKEDPEKLFQLVEIIGTGSYGEVFKVGPATACFATPLPPNGRGITLLTPSRAHLHHTRAHSNTLTHPRI